MQTPKRKLGKYSHLKSAIVIAPQKNNTKVQIGSTVEVETGKKQKTFTILGSSETNPLKGIISYNSPIGSALLNKMAGDIVRIELKERQIEYKIIKIY